MRLFDSDGNGYLDFKEFLMAIDIATCQTEESRLAWVFKLYDVDNDGVIDVKEMAFIMETLETLDSSGELLNKYRQHFSSWHSTYAHSLAVRKGPIVAKHKAKTSPFSLCQHTRKHTAN